MEATLDKAWEEGCYKAMLMTGSRNPATHAFYEACGFSPPTPKTHTSLVLDVTELCATDRPVL